MNKKFKSKHNDNIVLHSKQQMCNNLILVTVEEKKLESYFHVYLNKESSFELGQQLIEQSKQLK